MTTMIAYHGRPELKEQYLQLVRARRAADEEKQHIAPWRDGSDGIFREFVIDRPSRREVDYETELGFPRVLASLNRRIFGSLGFPDIRSWPERFLEAIAVGADLSLVWPQYAAWLQLNPDFGVITFCADERQVRAVQRLAALFDRVAAGDVVEASDWESALTHADYLASVAAQAAFDRASDDAWRKKAWGVQATKLLELLAAAPIVEAVGAR